MTLAQAIAFLFDELDLPMIFDNAIDRAKQDDAWDGPPSAHPLVTQCTEAIAVLREAKGRQWMEVERVGG